MKSVLIVLKEEQSNENLNIHTVAFLLFHLFSFFGDFKVV